MAHGLGQVQGGRPLAVVGADLVGGRAHPLREGPEQAQLGLAIGNSNRLGRQPPRLVARISPALELPGLGNGLDRPQPDDRLRLPGPGWAWAQG
jgi:hypothetical protein